jgi:hypothetical protein
MVLHGSRDRAEVAIHARLAKDGAGSGVWVGVKFALVSALHTAAIEAAGGFM